MNIKKTLVASVISFSAIAGHAVFAAESTDLSVKGTITVGGCTPQFSSSTGDTVYLGNWNGKELPTTPDNDVIIKTADLTIHCDSPTKVAFSTVDNRADSLMDVSNFHTGHNNAFYGLGKTADGVNIGAFSLRQSSKPVADGDYAKMVHTRTGNAWTDSETIEPNRIGNVRYSLAKDFESLSPAAITDGHLYLVMDFVFQSPDILNITDETPIDGSITVNLSYL